MTVLEATVEITIAVVESATSAAYLLNDTNERKKFLEGIDELYKRLMKLEVDAASGQ